MTDELDFKVYKILHIPTARCHGIFDKCLYFSDKTEAEEVVNTAKYGNEEHTGIIYISSCGLGFPEGMRVCPEQLEILEVPKQLVPNHVYSNLRSEFYHGRGAWSV